MFERTADAIEQTYSKLSDKLDRLRMMPTLMEDRNAEEVFSSIRKVYDLFADFQAWYACKRLYLFDFTDEKIREFTRTYLHMTTDYESALRQDFLQGNQAFIRKQFDNALEMMQKLPISLDEIRTDFQSVVGFPKK